MSSAAPLEGPAQPCLQSEEEWTKIKGICERGTADTQGPWSESKDTWSKGQQTPWGLHFSFLLLCLLPIAHLGVAM